MGKIAIVVPVYKVKPYLNRCVRSILNQTIKDFELILIDDGCPDECGALCDDYAASDSRVHVIHQKNGGLSAARNAGIDWVVKYSNADAVTFVDSDDFVVPEYLAVLRQGLTEEVDVACAVFTHVSDGGFAERGRPDCGWCVMSPEEYWIAGDSTAYVAVSKLYRKSLFQGVRYPVGKLHEDVFTTHQLVFKARMVASNPVAIYKYYIRSGSITQEPWSPRHLDMVEALKEQRDYFRTHGFARAEEFARGRLIAHLASVLPFLDASDPELAATFRREISDELGRRSLPFWENRDYYRVVMPRKLFFVRWGMAMMWNALTKGRRSWLLNESLQMVSSAWFDCRCKRHGWKGLGLERRKLRIAMLWQRTIRRHF